MKTVSAFCLVAIAIGTLAASAHAEDIDLYAGSSSSGDLPNVLLILDSSANWSSNIGVPNCYYKDNGVVTTDGPRPNNPNSEQGTKMAIEKCALNDVIDALPTGPAGEALFNVGLMIFNESPSSNSGGYPRIAMQPLTATAKTTFKAAIRSIGINADKGNNAAFTKSLYEAFLYFRGSVPYKGTAGTKWDTAATAGGSAIGNYLRPVANGCGKNHIIFIANGGPGENTDNEARDLLRSLGGNTTLIDYPSSYVSNSDEGNWADEFARFMYSADVSSKDGNQSILTHAVAVTGASSDGLYPNYMDSIAKHGGTSRAIRAANANALAVELGKIFAQIQSVSSVFASASLPISVNARGTYLNQIFMGMFLPDPVAKPRWDGNLKQYKFAYTQATDTLQLADQNGDPAIDGSSGFIKASAQSFWTHSSAFWTNSASGTPLSTSDSPDGSIVAKGAAAQLQRDAFMTSQATRKVYTCVGCAANTDLTDTTATSFEDGNLAITTAMLGAASDTERTNLIDWTRGTDNVIDDERGPGGTTTVRPSLHGDVLHSRPAAVNYGGSTGVVVFYGANDGMLHALNGNQSGAGAGSTLWSFVPQEMFGLLNRQRKNTPLISFPGVPAVLSPAPRGYFVDGPISVYQKFNPDGTINKVYLYIGMRRGGRLLYAFDVTDPNAPAFLWKKSNADIALLGQTWSEAKVAKIRGYANPVIIMGAGYDAVAEDAAVPGTVNMGNSVLVLDALTGTLLRKFGGIARPVPADVSLLDSDYDGFIDRAYAVDLGGDIHRIDFEVGAASGSTDWTINKLATLGSSGGKKFFYAPDVVLTRDYAAVMVGSGDREKPLLATTSDYFYTVLDREMGKGVSASFATTTFGDLQNYSTFNVSSDRGCYLALDTAGEKVVNAPLTIAGMTYFGTNKPAPPTGNSCSANLGIAQTYTLPLMCHAPTAVELNGGGLPPSPVAGIVAVSYLRPDGTEVERQMPFCIGCGANSSPIEGERVHLPVTPKRTRRYWFNEGSQ